MYVILYRYKTSINPSDTWMQVQNSLYFDKKKAVSDCESLNKISTRFDYQVYQLKEIK